MKKMINLIIVGLFILSGFIGLFELTSDTVEAAGLADSPWPMFQFNARRTGLSPYDTSNNNGFLKWEFHADDYMNHPVIGIDGTIFITSGDHKLYAINPDGSLKWSYHIGSAYPGDSPAIDSDGNIYFVGGLNLFAINPDGTLKWKYTRSGNTYTQNFNSPVIDSSGNIYANIYDTLYVVKPDGNLKWSYYTGSSESSPAIGEDGTIYLTNVYTELLAINSNGSLKWSYDIGVDSRNFPSIGSDGTIYVGCNDQGLYAFNPDGTLKWNYATSSISSTAAIGLDGTIYVGTYYGKLLAINPDGSLKWDYKTGDSVASAAVGADGTIYVGSSYKIFAINPDGSLKWTYQTHGYLYRTKSIAIGDDGSIYTGCSYGYLYAVGGDNNHPNVEINYPLDDQQVSGIIQITGNADVSYGSIQKVEVKIDSGNWQLADSTTSWSFEWDTTTVNDGSHTIYAQSYDGTDYSAIQSVNVIVDNGAGSSEDGLIAYWSFDEGSGTMAYDSSENNNDGTIHGATWTTGISEEALSFDGINDYVDFGDKFELSNGTIEFWFKPAEDILGSLDQKQVIYSKSYTHATASFFISIQSNGVLAFSILKSYYPSTWHRVFSTTINWYSDSWNHIACVWGLTGMNLYVNGDLEDSDSGISEVKQSSYSAVIGAWKEQLTNPEYTPFEGIIDEVRIYNRALSENEIQDLYNRDFESVNEGNTPPSFEVLPPTLKLYADERVNDEYGYLFVKYTDVDGDTPDLEVFFNGNWYDMDPHGDPANDGNYENGELFYFPYKKYIPAGCDKNIEFMIKCSDGKNPEILSETYTLYPTFTDFEIKKDGFSFDNDLREFSIFTNLLGGYCYGMSKTASDLFYMRMKGQTIFPDYSDTYHLPKPIENLQVYFLILTNQAVFGTKFNLIDMARISLLSDGPKEEYEAVKHELELGKTAVILIPGHVVVVYGILDHDTNKDGIIDAATMFIYDPNRHGKIDTAYLDLNTNKFYYYGPYKNLVDNFVYASSNIISAISSDTTSDLIETGGDFIAGVENFVGETVESLSNLCDSVTSIQLFCPADIHVYDKYGNHVGLNHEGNPEAEIPYSIIIKGNNETIVMIVDSSQDYTYDVTGNGKGTYNLDISKQEKSVETTFTVENIPTEKKSNHQFTVDWEKLFAGENGVNIKIDSDGDGYFETSTVADSDFTLNDYYNVVGNIDEGNNDWSVPGIDTPGFELFLVVCALALILFCKRKRK